MSKDAEHASFGHFGKDTHFIISPRQLFKLDWVLMSIVLLCIIAMVLYGAVGAAEKWYRNRR